MTTPYYFAVKFGGFKAEFAAHQLSSIIQSATLNGKPLDTPFLRHGQIVGGGELIFEMGPLPNKKMGSGRGWRVKYPPVLALFCLQSDNRYD